VSIRVAAAFIAQQQQLDKPKIERAKVRSGHAHPAATPAFDVQ
jgi:hypothetical protein